MALGPPADASLDGCAADGREEEFYGEPGGVAAVGPEAVIACCDAETGPKVVDEGPEEGWAVKGGGEGEEEAEEGEEDDGGCVDPVYVMVPVAPGHGLVADMWFFGCSFWCGHGHMP